MGWNCRAVGNLSKAGLRMALSEGLWYTSSQLQQTARHVLACRVGHRQSEEAAVSNFADHTPIPEGYKHCNNGSKCVNPNGSILPATMIYFYRHKFGKNGLYGKCKVS